MKKLALIAAAGALAAFMTTGSAVAQENDEVDPHSECVEQFNAEWGPPGKNVGPGARADGDARERNALRKEACDPLKGDNDNDNTIDPD
jgi:hypothetical protein